MQKKFEINQIEIKGGCQLGRKAVIHNSKSDLPLVNLCIFPKIFKNVTLVLVDTYWDSGIFGIWDSCRELWDQRYRVH